MSDNEFKKRIESEAKAASVITNKDLVCSDCIFRTNDSDPFKNGEVDDTGRVYGPTGICGGFSGWKPNKVLLGGECEKYEKEA